MMVLLVDLDVSSKDRIARNGSRGTLCSDSLLS